jgi:signal transduction histidine kinase/DNA-binding response OmpR family regulator
MSKRLRALIVDDSENDAALLALELRRGGYDVTCERVETPATMNSALAKQTWDLIISDYTMPHFSGLDALELLKNTGIDVPFLMVSGSIGEETAVDVMKAGAHDYLMKDNLRRLVPSVDRELREAEVRRERRRIEEENQRHWHRLRALHEIDLAITSTLDLKAILDILLEKIDHLLPPSVTTVKLIDKERGELKPVACRNLNETQWKAVRRKELTRLTQIVLENKIPLTVANVQTDPRNNDPTFAIKEGLISYLGIPLIAKNETLGVIAFYIKEFHWFSDDEIEFLTTLAGQASVAINNSLLYEQSRQQAVDLERSNKIKDEFLGVISHELRTPVNVIAGYADLVKEGSLGEINSGQRTILNRIVTCTTDLLEMVNGILYATSLEAKAIRAQCQPVDICDFLNELRSNYGASLDKGLTLNWEYPSDLPVLETDGPKLRHIFQNLIGNAIKFTKQGTVTISARHNSQNKTVEFKVSDTGIGIAKELHRAIFEKFRQADSSASRAYEGVGLGLYIVKQFAELIGGTVNVESDVGSGSTFTITIPVKVKAGGSDSTTCEQENAFEVNCLLDR